MKIITEEVEGSLYSEFILFPADIEKLQEGKIVDGVIDVRKRPCYISILKAGPFEALDDSDDIDF